MSNYYWLLCCLVLIFFIKLISTMFVINSSVSYLDERAKLIQSEANECIGSAIILNENEQQVDNILLSEKQYELSHAYKDSTTFLPNQHFFVAKKQIEQSNIFKIIKQIPKGASLHTHLLAAVSVDFIINNITYRDNLYGCFMNHNELFKLRFLSSAEEDNRYTWKLLKEYRNESENFDEELRKRLSLNDGQHYKSPEELWKKFKNIFSTVYDMLSFRPVFEDYIYQLLKELYDDKVIYTELKGTFMPLYELNGKIYNNEEFLRIFQNVVDKFKKSHVDFIGVKYIHSIYRGVEPTILKQGLDELKRLNQDFIAGFDFVGFEEEGRFIRDYAMELLEIKPDLKFFFHAGESNWYGHTEENLIDAVLLESSRIGHGFGLLKHPEVLEMAKSKKIAIEVCPISNQVLMLNKDVRNHPATHLVAIGYPIVIGNDDPSIWDATGLSYDWYIFFMGMTSKNSGLKVLKQIALNSIEYSAMNEGDKKQALINWEHQWNEFIEKFLKFPIKTCSKD